MKKINTLTMMILLTFSFSIAQELEVQGDLNVTGTIESATIDSMQQLIDGLQVQINAMHADNQLETRVYELPRFNFDGVTTMDLDLSQITGYDLDYALLTIVYVTNHYTEAVNQSNIALRHRTYPNGNANWNYDNISISADDETVEYSSGYLTYVNNGHELELHQSDYNAEHNGYVDIVLSVTAEFPD